MRCWASKLSIASPVFRRVCSFLTKKYALELSRLRRMSASIFLRWVAVCFLIPVTDFIPSSSIPAALSDLDRKNAFTFWLAALPFWFEEFKKETGVFPILLMPFLAFITPPVSVATFIIAAARSVTAPALAISPFGESFFSLPSFFSSAISWRLSPFFFSSFFFPSFFLGSSFFPDRSVSPPDFALSFFAFFASRSSQILVGSFTG